MNYKFVLIDSNSEKDRMAWVLPLPVTVGRIPGVEIQIDDPSISRRHCQFILDVDGALTIRDLDSMNGIYVDDQRVKRAILRPGIVVQIGSRSLRIEWTSEPISTHPVVLENETRATQPMIIPPKTDY
jgi:pSer/pThr/pTyr-binding forkhead associated (FHA) protein